MNAMLLVKNTSIVLAAKDRTARFDLGSFDHHGITQIKIAVWKEVAFMHTVDL